MVHCTEFAPETRLVTTSGWWLHHPSSIRIGAPCHISFGIQYKLEPIAHEGPQWIPPYLWRYVYTHCRPNGRPIVLYYCKSFVAVDTIQSQCRYVILSDLEIDCAEFFTYILFLLRKKNGIIGLITLWKKSFFFIFKCEYVFCVLR